MADETGAMLSDQDLRETDDRVALESLLDNVRAALREEQALNQRYRTVIEQHLARGCPSRSLRTLLLETDPTLAH